MPTDSAQTPLSAAMDSAAGDATAAAPQHQPRQLDNDQSAVDEVPTSSIPIPDKQQIGKTAGPQIGCAGQDGFPPSAAPHDHLCQRRLKPEEMDAPLATSSSQPHCSPSSASPTGISAPTAAATLGHGLDQQVAVLSVLAGAAVDPASALTLPLLPDATDPSAVLQDPAANPLVEERAGLGSNSASSSSSLDIYDALREDRAYGEEDWQLVKASRKGSAGSIKATLDTSEKQTGAGPHQGQASKRREQPMESHVRSQEAAHEAAGVSGDATHVAKHVPRSSSQASMSSCMSLDTADAQDRYSRGACKEWAWGFFPVGLQLLTVVLLYCAPHGLLLLLFLLLLLLLLLLQSLPIMKLPVKTVETSCFWVLHRLRSS